MFKNIYVGVEGIFQCAMSEILVIGGYRQKMCIHICFFFQVVFYNKRLCMAKLHIMS